MNALSPFAFPSDLPSRDRCRARRATNLFVVRPPVAATHTSSFLLPYSLQFCAASDLPSVFASCLMHASPAARRQGDMGRVLPRRLDLDLLLVRLFSYSLLIL